MADFKLTKHKVMREAVKKVLKHYKSRMRNRLGAPRVGTRVSHESTSEAPVR